MLPDADKRHGTNAGHNAGCRCAPCNAAKLAYDKRRRFDLMQGNQRTIPAWRLTRRIEALQARGWSLRAIAAEAGVVHNHLVTYGTGRKRVYAETFYKIADAYERLAMKEPPQVTQGQKSGVARTKNFARRNGYAPPLAWDDIDSDESPNIREEYFHKDRIDEVVVQRVLGGQAPQQTVTPAERREITRRWIAAGRGANELARLTGWKPERYYQDDVA